MLDQHGGPSNQRPFTRIGIAGVSFLAALMMLAPARAVDCSSQDLPMIDMTICADQRLKDADSILNGAYVALMKKIEAPDQQRLRAAEKAWIAFRDSECLYRIGGEDQGGTLWPMLELRCKAELTEARATEIRGEIKCPSFDLSCTRN
jgi:uncharacterized protein YecT (DUF1311 family)